MTQVQHQLDNPTYVISEDEEIRRGQEAWSRLKKHMSWTDWTSVGKAHLKGRTVAMGEANTNEPTGRRYNQIFGEWLTRHGFDDIDKGDRSRLFEVMEHLDEIETWLATVPTSNRLRLNHPVTVLRKWRACTQIPTQSKKPPKAAHRSAALRVKKLRVELDAANAHIVELEAARDAEAAAAFEADSVRVAKAVAAAKRALMQKLQPHFDELELGVALLRGDAERRDAPPAVLRFEKH
jgi:hypothetical protein